MPYRCQIIADSVSPAGKRLTTFEITYNRFVHSELLTHRMFSRNSSSSRAIPVEKLMAQIRDDPAMPVYWGKNQKGMQATEELTGEELMEAKAEWLLARDNALASATVLSQRLNLHKQIANRLLEPWMYITVLVTATEWDNWFTLRCHPMAQQELRKIAEMMRDAYADHEPNRLFVGDWHRPFWRAEDEELEDRDAKKVCVARCARVSYLTHDGRRDVQKDIDLAESLTKNGHWSPFEHVAQALNDPQERVGNFFGWRQYRADVDPGYIR